MVIGQLRQFLTAPDAAVPIRFDKCISTEASRTEIYEPFADLIACLWDLLRYESITAHSACLAM